MRGSAQPEQPDPLQRGQRREMEAAKELEILQAGFGVAGLGKGRHWAWEVPGKRKEMSYSPGGWNKEEGV